MDPLRLTYYPDITQHRTPEEVRSAVVLFAGHLGSELSRVLGAEASVEVLPVVDVARQTAMIAAGECEIGLLKPSSYVLAHRRNPRVVPAAVALRTIDGEVGDSYFAQIYARVKSGITSMDDLKRRCHGPDAGKRPALAFGDPFSTANFLVPAAHLLELGLHPFTRFRSSGFYGGHDGAVKAVYSGLADVGAGHDGVIIDLAKQTGYADAAQELVRLDRVFIHSDPVAMCVEDDMRTVLTQALLTISTNAEVKRALDIFWGAVVGLGETRHENYSSVEQAINTLAIAERDILV